VTAWFWYAVAAAILYGAHQIFTKLAADRIGEGLGGFIVEATAALSILVYLAFLWLASRWNQQSSAQGIFYSVLTGVCVGAGTIAFFLLFQKGGPLSVVPVILAVAQRSWPSPEFCSSGSRHRGRGLPELLSR
jgi:bacterial/archaeal transporter family protein